MATSNRHAAEAPNNSQQQLASELVECLGRDGAVHVCKVNGSPIRIYKWKHWKKAARKSSRNLRLTI